MGVFWPGLAQPVKLKSAFIHIEIFRQQIITEESFIYYLTKYVTKDEPDALIKVGDTIGGYLKSRDYGVPEIVFY